jgi:hypothetical protein
MNLSLVRPDGCIQRVVLDGLPAEGSSEARWRHLPPPLGALGCPRGDGDVVERRQSDIVAA